MSKWVSYGFSPGNDLEARRAREIEGELLREYLPVILGNSERILETPRYFFCQPGSAFLSCSFFYGGGGPIPLGVLLLLWDAGEMIFDCPTCAGSLYAVGLHRLLGGSGCVWGVCAGCRQWQKFCHGHLGASSRAVGELLRVYRNEPIIEKAKRPVFDWKDGLKGEFTPDRVIVPAVEPVDIRSLIVELRGSAFKDGREEGELLPELRPTKQAPRPITRGFTYPILLEKKRR